MVWLLFQGSRRAGRELHTVNTILRISAPLLACASAGLAEPVAPPCSCAVSPVLDERNSALETCPSPFWSSRAKLLLARLGSLLSKSSPWVLRRWKRLSAGSRVCWACSVVRDRAMAQHAVGRQILFRFMVFG